jgi:hypothetical protein
MTSEGIRKMTRQAAGQDGHDVVTLRKHSIIALPRQPQITGSSDTVLRRWRHGVDGAHVVTARLHFHENRQIALACNNVDLAELGAIAQCDDAIPLSMR